MKIRLFLLGFGNVGRAFASHLVLKQKNLIEDYGLEFEITGISDSEKIVLSHQKLDILSCIREKEELNRISIENNTGVKILHRFNYALLKEFGIDCVIETLPSDKVDGGDALVYVRECLAAGISVVTANKGVLVFGYESLNKLCQSQKVSLKYSASTGGALPVADLALNSFLGDRIISVEGILNGTTNYILTKMEEKGESLDSALKTAQSLGIAEPDPTFDLDGWDTAMKLLIIAKMLGIKNISLKDIHLKGIDNNTVSLIRNAKKSNSKVRLIGRLDCSKQPAAGVSVETINEDHPFYSINETNKAVLFNLESMGKNIIQGGESGRTSIAATLLKDLTGIYSR